MNRLFLKILGLITVLMLASCQESSINDFAPKEQRALPQKIIKKIEAKGMAKTSPILFRIFKDEHVLEVWKQKNTGKFEMIANYNICAWSGTLGPKLNEGDRQAPEGYYPITPTQMNPASQYYLAINTGFPNLYDRAQGRTGTNLMIHGACSSSGCYSMTDDNVQEIFAFARDSFAGEQKEIMLQALPFRMTAEKMALYSKHKDFMFWNMLKQGYDYFEITKTPPRMDFCENKYVFNVTRQENRPFTIKDQCPPQEPLSAHLLAYNKSYQLRFEKAMGRLNNTPFPIVYGGKSRPLNVTWKPEPVQKPTMMSSILMPTSTGGVSVSSPK
jgi:murein L,D-transpeptidase YafK